MVEAMVGGMDDDGGYDGMGEPIGESSTIDPIGAVGSMLSESERMLFQPHRLENSRTRSLKRILQHPEGIHMMPANSSRVIFSHYFKDRGRPTCFQHIYVNPWFERVALVVIVLNAFWIGFDVDYNTEDSEVPKEVFEVGEFIFCTVFVLELFIRFMAYSRTVLFFTDPDMYLWNIFDLCLVLLMVVDTWVLKYIVQVEAGEMQAVSSLRLLRLLRLTRIMRLVPELGMMVTSLLAALRSVASTCILGLGIMYIFAIFLTQWTKSYGSAPKCVGAEGYKICLQDYFGDLPNAFLTLTQILTFDDTFEVVRPVMHERLEMGILLIVYMLLVCFTVLNMLIGIICDVVNEVSIQEKEKMLRTRMEDLFRHLDADQSGFVSREEFETNGISHLVDLGIDQHLTRAAFDMLDIDGDGMITCSEFVTMIFKCLHPVASEDIMKLETSVERLAELTGLGRNEVAILAKDRKKSPGREARQSEELAGEDQNLSGEPTREETFSDYMQKEEFRPVLDRFGEVHKRLEDLQLLIEASPLSTSRVATAAGNPHLEANFQSLPSNPQTDALASVLRPTLQVLTARLHALRAECKAHGMQYAGDLTGSLGAKRGKFVNLLHLRPLDELMTEVIQWIKFTNEHLLPSETMVVASGSAFPRGPDARGGSSAWEPWRGFLSAVGAAASTLSRLPADQKEETLSAAPSSFETEDEAEAPGVRTGPIIEESLLP